MPMKRRKASDRTDLTKWELYWAQIILKRTISYQRGNPGTASAHCMRRSCSDVLEILEGHIDDVQLDR